jgi:hypothetical protein
MYVSGIQTGTAQAALLWRAVSRVSPAPVREVEAPKTQATSAPDELWMYRRALRGAEQVTNYLEQSPDL